MISCHTHNGGPVSCRSTLSVLHPVCLFFVCYWECSSTNHHGHYYLYTAEKMAFGRLRAPDEDVIRAVYLGPQQHTSLHHTTRLLGNRSLWWPLIGGGLWIDGENTYVSTECSGQAAAHCYSKTKKGKILKNERNILNHCLSLAQSLKASRISVSPNKCMSQSGEVWGRNEYERHGGLKVCVCVGGTAPHPPGSFSWYPLCSSMYFLCCSRTLTLNWYFTNVLHYTPPCINALVPFMSLWRSASARQDLV